MKDFPKGDKNNALWWVITGALFLTGGLSAVAIVLAILNVNGKLPPVPALIEWLKGQFSNDGQLRREAQNAAEQVKRAAEDFRQTAPAPRRKKTLKKPKTGGLRMGFGIALLALGLVLALYGAGSIFGAFTGTLHSFTGVALPMGVPAFFTYTVLGGLMLAAGILLLVFGGAARARANARYRRMSNLVQMLGSGADMAGRSYSQTMNDLQELIDMGYFEGLWLDRAAGMLRRRPYGERAEAPKAENLTQAERILRQIRADNDLIDDAELSEKIDRIEDLTRKIFAFQEKNPERADENRTFMNYYLPQTLKLLETYARLEASGADVSNVHTTKQKISEGLDKLISGFERHLDKLYSSDVIDITADIRVMEQMLEKEGRAAPRFIIDKSVTDFYSFTRDSFSLQGYDPHDFTDKIPVAI